MAVKRYDGSAWQVVAGKGDQGTSSSISTWVKTASGGETSLSGNDDNSQSLSYTVGQELVFINGTLLKRGSDYTATNGTSITGLTALAANDVATVWTVNAFSVTNAISNTLVDAKGDLIVATAADTPARLAVGSANQVLTVDSSTATGLKWATPAADTNGFVYITSSTFSNVASVSVDGCFTSTYETYMITIHNFSAVTTADTPRLTLRYATQDLTSEHYSSFWYHNPSNDAYYGSRSRNVGYFTIGRYSGQSVYPSNGFVMIGTIGTDTRPTIWGQMGNADTETAVSFGGISTSARTYTGFKLSSSASNISGTVRVYGLVKS